MDMSRDLLEVARRFAAAKGIAERPVVMLTWANNEIGDAVSEAALGEVLMPEGDAENGRMPAAILSPGDAARVLRQCAYDAGEVAARTLEQNNPPIDVWLAMCSHEGLVMRGFSRDDVALLHAVYAYRGRNAQTVEEQLNDGGPSRFGLMTDHGGIHVYGRTGADAALAAALVGIVETGKATVPYGGGTVTVPVNDDALADLLASAYAGAEGAHQIAEAARALKKLPGGRDGRLLRVLRNRPGLAELYRLVRGELTGEVA